MRPAGNRALMGQLPNGTPKLSKSQKNRRRRLCAKSHYRTVEIGLACAEEIAARAQQNREHGAHARVDRFFDHDVAKKMKHEQNLVRALGE